MPDTVLIFSRVTDVTKTERLPLLKILRNLEISNVASKFDQFAI